MLSKTRPLSINEATDKGRRCIHIDQSNFQYYKSYLEDLDFEISYCYLKEGGVCLFAEDADQLFRISSIINKLRKQLVET